MTLGLGFVLPVLAGHFADRKFETGPACLLVGMVVGFSVGVYSIVKIATGSGPDGSSKAP